MGLVAPRLALASLVAVVVLAFGATSAHAVTYGFTVTPESPNPGQTVTFQLTPTSAAVERVRWDLDNDGAFDDGDTRTVTRSFATPGPVTVRMQARETSRSPNQAVTQTFTVNGKPAADFGFTPGDPVAGDDVAFSPEVTDPNGDAVTLAWDFGDGTLSSGGAPTHAFAAPGTYEVRLTATDEHGAATSVTHSVRVAEDPGPAPSFVYSPSAPMEGDPVTFTSTSTPSRGSITTTEWDLDGDGAYDVEGSEVSATFAPGAHTVTMRVTQSNGRQAVWFTDVTVAKRPAPPPPPAPGPDPPAGDDLRTGTSPPADPAPAPALSLIRPFPVVRIAGVVLPKGALVKILSVRAPRGAGVLARCRGRGCPARAVARSTASPVLRIHRFERRLRAGVTLELFVHKGARIGKYTRFRIRANRPPARLDRCLMPKSNRPVRCP
jgi:PKD repeat protein